MDVRQISPINEVIKGGQAIIFVGPESNAPALVFGDPAMVVPSVNPIIADEAGRVHRVYTDRDDVMWLPYSHGCVTRDHRRG